MERTKGIDFDCSLNAFTVCEMDSLIFKTKKTFSMKKMLAWELRQLRQHGQIIV
ncbi:hypothetical protein SMD22_00505 (plasmid) [Brevibacillus halotolerans]|nr:hypothetical protein SMD22_00505 [Brevibacillus halotolerans]